MSLGRIEYSYRLLVRNLCSSSMMWRLDATSSFLLFYVNSFLKLVFVH